MTIALWNNLMNRRLTKDTRDIQSSQQSGESDRLLAINLKFTALVVTTTPMALESRIFHDLF